MSSFWQYMLLTLLGMIVIKATINGYRLWRIVSLEKQYHDFMQKMVADQAVGLGFLEKIPEIIELFKKAGQKSPVKGAIEPVGLGHARSFQVDYFENMAVADRDIYSGISVIFKKTIGIYKKNIYDAFNPIYWLELVIYFPQNIIEYVSDGNDKKVVHWSVRLLNILYWLVAFISGICAIYDHFK